MDKTFVVRCRGIILDQGELLTVEHVGKEGCLALPGGHLEWGEDIQTGLRRELIEELGVEPIIGDLLYIHTYTQPNGKQPVEFFFKILNASDYRTLGTDRSHAYELATVEWIKPDSKKKLRPAGLLSDFQAGRLGDGQLRYLVDGVLQASH